MIYLGILVALVPACERSQSPESLPPGFSTRILEDFFVISIAFDADGTAWIGTFDRGLIRYTPGQTTLYNASNSPVNDTLVIRSLATDSRGNVWLGNGGLLRFDGQTFTRYTPENSPMPSAHVGAIAIDSRDVVWFSNLRSGEGGLIRFDGTHWDIYTPLNSALPDYFIHDICVDLNDDIWLALSKNVSNNRLVRISGDNWQAFSEEDLGFSPYMFGNLAVNSRNEIFASIDYSLSSMFRHPGPEVIRFDGITCEQIFADSTFNARFISIDRKDRIWCAGYPGYGIYAGGTWTMDNTSFAKTGIFAIEESPDGRMWIGTGEGIFISD